MEMAFVLTWWDSHLLRTSSKRWMAPLMHQSFHDVSVLFWNISAHQCWKPAESCDSDCWNLEMTFHVTPRKRQRQDFFHRVQVETWQKLLIPAPEQTQVLQSPQLNSSFSSGKKSVQFFSCWFVFPFVLQGHLIIGLWPWRWSTATQLNLFPGWDGWDGREHHAPDQTHLSQCRQPMPLVFALPSEF